VISGQIFVVFRTITIPITNRNTVAVKKNNVLHISPGVKGFFVNATNPFMPEATPNSHNAYAMRRFEYISSFFILITSFLFGIWGVFVF
jgi:hypothetical protein